MEKSTAHTKLAVVHQLIKEGKVNATKTAFNTAADLNVFTLSEMCKVVSSLTTKNFKKSMTTYQDHTKWQDVYLVTVNNTEAYVKLMVEEGVLIVSFKESES
ncbi:type II toxin-antitoxin system MqsR family toxin [Limnobacter parvus]|uniref:Type II toxin-antitoxin system MqsR family toxin n=1 Tax=Limnobacter parvus TaxID=2939690 RepID=A0ABT1XDR3_9BURK|nr:type II toxin-antitoxin system MqsR family toxin [Limnobacter parvus]MCR2745274.1 type II toxin-antitoxin system MqsR family toxin [Limnobacter parvus]